MKDCDPHEDNEISLVSFPKFMEVLENCNYSIFNPRNGMRDICIPYEAKNISQEQYW